MTADERYIRQMMLPEIGAEGQQKLKEAKVLVVGVGGLGSPISLYLTAAGVGRIGLVDDDAVSEHNLQRQVLYAEPEIGRSKVECAQKRLSVLNSHTRFDIYPTRLTAENAETLIAKYDIVVDGCDNAATRYLIDEVCARQKKPYVYGSISGFKGQVSVFNYQGGPRYRDLYPRPETVPPAVPGGVVGTTPGIAGCTEAAEVIKIITGCGRPLSGRLFLFDTLNSQYEVIEL